METLRQVLNESPARPRLLNRNIPADLETIALKCLHKEPAHRYASAQALADDLRRYLDGRPILARRAGQLNRVWRWSRRNPALATLTLFSVLPALALATAATLRLAARNPLPTEQSSGITRPFASPLPTRGGKPNGCALNCANSADRCWALRGKPA